MIKIAFVSENSEEVSRISKIFAKNPYEFTALCTEMQSADYLQIVQPDIVFLDSSFASAKQLAKQIKSYSDSNIIILYITNSPEPELLKTANAFITKEMPDNLITSTVSVNLKTKNALEKLSNSNKDLADSLYRLNALYSTSSNFAETLDKKKLLSYMVEGLDKALSFSLTCTLSFCTEDEPVLILNSLYEISDEILSALKLRTILNYKNAFENPPYEINEENLKVIKTVKYPGNRFTFSLFQYDNMFAPISLGENVFGCIEIYKDASFSSDDATCFQTIARQAALPLKNATLYQEIKETNHKLEKLERLKSEFISIVSHELRTPLTSIKNSLDILKSGKQKLVEFLACHVVVLDLPGAALVVDIVGRVGDDQVGLQTVHQQREGFRLGAVPADKPVPPQRPHIPGLGDSRLLQLGVHIELIILDPIFQAVFEEVIDLGGIKAGEGHIEVGALQIGDEEHQLVFVPIAGDFVEGDVEGFFPLLIHLHHHALHLGDAHVHEHLQPLMTAHHPTGGLVPDHRLHIAELLHRAFQLVVLRVAGL